MGDWGYNVGTSGRKWGEKMFLIGTYYHNLDEKNRVTLPSKLREKLGATVFITYGLDGCVTLYPEETYNQIASSLRNASSFEDGNRKYKRIFFGYSYECDVDKQGRIQLKPMLCDKCSIKKDVVIMGVDDHVEIWDVTLFESMSEENESNYEANASRIHFGE